VRDPAALHSRSPEARWAAAVGILLAAAERNDEDARALASEEEEPEA
jgi:hypothetical protein